VEEAISLGIWQTPAVFINGVELRGWNAPNGVRRAVERLAASHPEPMTAALDQPSPAMEKLIGDWRASPRRRIPPREGRRALGPDDARVRVVIFGDFQQSGTAEADAVVRGEVAARGDVRYEYRHFPFNKDCNPVVQKETKFPQACRAAQAAEAAASLAGVEGYWQMHVWLLEHQEAFSDAALREAATEIGIAPDALLAEVEKPDVRSAVVEDAKLGQRLGVSVVPSVFVNGQRVPRWKLEGENILPRIIAEAAEE
ncbi:MAG: DsbA family protein, partial [Phycisphaerae bacterium]